MSVKFSSGVATRFVVVFTLLGTFIFAETPRGYAPAITLGLAAAAGYWMFCKLME